MKRYCLRPDIKQSIGDIFYFIIGFYLAIATIIAISYPFMSIRPIYEESHIVIALVTSGSCMLLLGIFIVIKYTIKNYKDWFVEC